MSGVLALTGVTGKKSGSALIELIGEDPALVRALLPRGTAGEVRPYRGGGPA